MKKLLSKIKSYNPVLSPGQIRKRSLVFFVCAALPALVRWVAVRNYPEQLKFLENYVFGIFFFWILPSILIFFGFYCLLTGKLPRKVSQKNEIQRRRF